MLSHFNTTQKGILYAFMGFTAFAVADACAKWLGDSYTTSSILFWTYSIALVFALCLSPLLGGMRDTIKTGKLKYHIARGICALGIAFLAVSALRDLSLAMLYTILFLAPFVITIVAWPIFNEPVKPQSWAIIVLGFSGVIIALRPDITEFSIGMVYAFCALLFIVGLSIFARPLDNRETLLSLSFYPSMIITTVTGLLLFPNITLPKTADFPVFLLNGATVVLGLSGIAQGFRIAPFAAVAPVHYCQMIAAFIIGYFIFEDVPSFWMLTGACIIILAGIMLVFSSTNNQDVS